MIYAKELIKFKTARIRREFKDVAVLILTGLIAGSLCGFFGGGGGSVIVPSLTFLIKEEQKKSEQKKIFARFKSF